MALRAGGSAPNITALLLRDSVALVSGQCGVPQWPGTTKLSPGVGQRRGHVPPPVAALDGNVTSPLHMVRCSVVSVSGHSGLPPCPSSTKLSLGMRGSFGVRPLQPPASLLHNAPFCEVCVSRCAKAPLGATHRFAPSRVHKTGVMQSGLRWGCGCRGTWALVRRFALGCWPPPTLGASPLRGIGPCAGLPVRPPWGLPQPSAQGSRRLTAANHNPYSWCKPSTAVCKQSAKHI